MNPLIQLKKATPIFLGVFVLVCLTLSPRLQAVVPPPDGGYPNFTTAEGTNALQALTSGVGNTAIGTFSLFSVTAGSFNTAVGSGALDLNTADSNTATGAAALLFNTTGTENTANGTAALEFNDSGNNNTAVGAFALFSNTEGDTNTASGEFALYFNTTGGGNTATGYNALYSNTTGNLNTANGAGALLFNTTGSLNTALGFGAGQNLTGDNNVCIGADVFGVAGEINTTRIRNIYDSVANGRAVYVNSGNKIGTLVSSRRFKEEIKPMDQASEVLFALKPVSFRYKKEFDAGRAPMFGLIAEDVEQVDPDLVSRNEKGEVETVRYEAVNAMLLNEFLKEHRKVEAQNLRIQEQEATIAGLKKEVASLAATVKEQATQIQRVSAQIAMNERASQTVAER